MGRLRADATFSGPRLEPRRRRHWLDDWLWQVFEWAVPAPVEERRRRARSGPRRAAPSGCEARSGPAPTEPAKGLALLAVGSLGRGDLAPGSDLDLLLVHDGRSDVGEVADRLWYPIWDDPMPLDHSVRTLSQVGQAAESDLRVALGLLDARPLVGEGSSAGRTGALGRRLWEKRVGKLAPGGARRPGARPRTAHGDVAFLLEPDLKEGRGGLARPASSCPSWPR